MKFPTLNGAAALLLLAASCANPVNLKTASQYYEAGLVASQRGDHYHGAVLYSRALGNAELGGADDKDMAMTLYAYGRELALLGEFEEGVEKLEESLRVQREVTPPTPSEILRRLSVLGRIYLDTGRATEALPVLQETVAMLRSQVSLDIPPGDYMYILGDLEKALAAAGSPTDLSAIRSELADLRAEHGDLPPSMPYERFTPEAVELRLSADLSPDQFKPQ